ncbi:RHO alpha subunit C-terminal catalytic domain-containing protein [Streptomyces mirabilis]|uniref:RHO alpha subunit C-terminal catalytic domain-containing protein n=1 Tax=Streptomyces mirabilis TaxID=68239 RepID=UPI0021BDFCC0|nr:RHO alpha subunit C-terminal catalytic domain-containing protein [Streptomyces mirabilis]MCT9104775.1 RHO alpha subunit C-terminal catalytic domain-containing protein [Streptomyces mirabilis]
MALCPKPAEGSWTEHYPDLGTGVVSSDQELLVRHFHRSIADWVEEYERKTAGA